MLNEILRLSKFSQAANFPGEVALEWISSRLLQFIAKYELLDSNFSIKVLPDIMCHSCFFEFF